MTAALKLIAVPLFLGLAALAAVIYVSEYFKERRVK